LCERIGVLPDPGGLFQQSITTVERLSIVLQCMDEQTEKDMKKRESEARVNEMAARG